MCGDDFEQTKMFIEGLSRGVASPDCPGGGGKVGELPGGGGCLRGDVPPSEAGRFWNFDTEFTQFSDNFYAKFIPLDEKCSNIYET